MNLMTTIVYDHKTNTITIDSRIRQGDFIVSDNAEKFIINGDDVYFLTGTIADFEPFVKRMSGEETGELKYELNCSAFLASDRVVYSCTMDSNGKINKERMTYSDSMGSGAVQALAAIDFGESAINAINYAKTRDSATGGLIRKFNVASMEFVA